MDTQFFTDPRLAELHGAASATAKSLFSDRDLSVPLTRAELLSAYRSLAPTGYLGGVIDRSLGGAGLSFEEYGAVLEGVSEIAPFLSNHSVQRSLVVAGTESQRERWLGPLLSAEAIGAVLITEPHGGTQVADVRTTLTPDGDGFRLTGQKIWCVHTMTADVGVVLAAGPDGKAVRCLVDLTHESVRRQQIEMSGLRYLTFGLIEFRDSPVAAGDLLIGQGTDEVKRTLAVARALVAVQAASVGQRAVYAAVKHLSTRNARGRAVTGLDLIRERIGELSARVEASRAFAYHALKAIDRDDASAPALASAAKANATDAAVAAATSGIELCAAEGLVAGAEIQRHRDDAAMLAIADGTPIVNHTLWGKYVIEQSLLRRP